MPNFINRDEIIKIFKENQDKQFMYRRGLDYRFSDDTGFSIPGYKRNKPTTLEDMLNHAEHYFIELEESKYPNQIVFHGYSAHDME